jgi:hypothetical protein
LMNSSHRQIHSVGKLPKGKPTFFSQYFKSF